MGRILTQGGSGLREGLAFKRTCPQEDLASRRILDLRGDLALGEDVGLRVDLALGRTEALERIWLKG